MKREICEADGAEYIVRINDDTEFVSDGWNTKGVSTLRGFDPPNVGVVAPSTLTKASWGTKANWKVKGTNEMMMVHDMNHRTHLEIFEFY